MDRRFHQSIKKHLAHTQHDLYLVNRIVSLYPFIIIALIPLAVSLMLSLRPTSRIAPILAQRRSRFLGSCEVRAGRRAPPHARLSLAGCLNTAVNKDGVRGGGGGAGEGPG